MQHQFSKVEMFAFCTPLMSESIHEEMLATQEELYKELGFHFRYTVKETFTNYHSEFWTCLQKI
jgi:seryl-tRNA synthetase